MTEERQDGATERNVEEALDDLRRALAIDPSFDFAARVRARVDDDRARASRWRGSRAWLVALVPTAAALVLALYLLPNQTPAEPDRSAAVTPVAPEPSSTAARTPAPTAATPESTAAPSARVTRSATQPNRTPTRAVMTAAAATPRREPEVLVPNDQRVALMRLLAALREGSASVPPSVPIVDETTGELLEPTPIEMRPIDVAPLPGTPVEIGSGKGER